jgi:acetyltransferase
MPAAEPATHILRQRRQPLDAFFAPSSVAVVGATETAGSVGRTVVANLLAGGYQGNLFPINPKRESVQGLRCYPRLKDVRRPIDLAVIITPAATVPGVIRGCLDAGVSAAVVISAGFREAGAAGQELERQIKSLLQGQSLRVIGPNCLGIMSPRVGLNATFAAGAVRPGNVAMLSQSGALLTSILDWSLQEHVGFSAIVSVGSMLDVGWGDLIDWFCDDPQTQSIVIYMESIGDARSFLSAAREITLRKPVIVIKAGRTEAAAKAAASHTGALTGSDEVLDAAFRRCGVLRVSTIADLFAMAEVLAKQPRPQGPRLTVLTNAGGPGVLAADALLAHGGELTPLAQETLTALDQILPAHWSHANPIDILGDAGPERYAKAVAIAAADPHSDGLLVILSPQDMTDPTWAAEQLLPFAHRTNKPLLASWMGGARVAAGASLLNQADIPTFSYADAAARIFCYMWRYTYNLRGIYETPALATDAEVTSTERRQAATLIDNVRHAGRTLLTELESKQLLGCYRLPTVPTLLARNEEEAVQQAQQIGFPVVLKLHSESITHKTDVGGVKLNLADAAAVRDAYQAIRTAVREQAGAEHFAGVTVQPMVKLDGYELIVGSSIDPQFGPVILFGTGGQLVEVFKDRALALPPLTTTLARRLMEQTKILTALKGVRGRKPVNLAALENLLVQFSWLVTEQRWIKEIDINPLLASPDRLLALDARVVLHDPRTHEDELPQCVIRPYPTQYVADWQLKDGTRITIRPIRPEDEPLMARFHSTLSDRTVYQRYLQILKLSQRVAHERLARLCFIDYAREIALLALAREPGRDAQEIVAVGRLVKQHGSPEAEFALLIRDAWQGRGLGTELLRRLVQVGRDEKLKKISSDILPENRGMQRVCEKLGFKLQASPHNQVVRAEIEL